MPVSTPARYQRVPDIVSADMDGEPVIMSLEANAYFGITGVGAQIWDMLAIPKTLEEIVVHICADYDVTPETCRTDAMQLLAQLQDHGLVQTL